MLTIGYSLDDLVDACGVIGKPPTPDYKVCATYADGYRLTVFFPIGGPRAADKGRRTAEEIIKRLTFSWLNFTQYGTSSFFLSFFFYERMMFFTGGFFLYFNFRN